jgi:hypothetical protein
VPSDRDLDEAHRCVPTEVDPRRTPHVAGCTLGGQNGDELDDELDDERLREIASSNLCRCTGYLPILAAVRRRPRSSPIGFDALMWCQLDLFVVDRVKARVKVLNAKTGESVMLVYIFAVVAAVSVVIVAAYLFRKLGRGIEDADPNGATVRHAGVVLSALFLLVFAISIVVPWSTADSARQNTYTEGQAIADAYWAAAELPAPVNRQVQSELHDYTRFVRDKEWPLMANGQLSSDGWRRLDKLRAQVTGLKTTKDAVRDTRSTVLGKLGDLSAARRLRAADAQQRSPSGVLVLTVLSGLAVCLFPILAGARPRGMTIVALLVMAGLVGLGVDLAFAIAHVFDGPLSVHPDAFTAVLQEFERTSGGG